MLGAWTPLFWLVALLVTLWWVSRRLAHYFMGSVYLLTQNEGFAVAAYAIFIIPGTLVHEISHWLIAQMVGVRTGSFDVLPKFSRDGTIQLGSVGIRGGNLAQLALIGLAPMIVGSVLTMWLSYGLVDVDALGYALESGRWSAVGVVLLASLRKPDALLALYLLFTISDSIFLSSSDRAPVQQLALYLGLALIPLYLFGILPALPNSWTAALQQGFAVFASGLAIALVVHVLLLILFGGIFYLVRSLSARR